MTVGQAGADEIQWRPVGSKKDSTVPPVAQLPQTAFPSSVEPQEAGATLPAPKVPAPVAAVPLQSATSALICHPTASSEPTQEAEPKSPVPAIVGQVIAEPLPDICDCDCRNVNWFSGLSLTRFWVRAEFLAWWTKSAGVPALLTTSTTPLPATDNNIGALGRSDTVVLLSGKQLDQQARPGARFSAGGSFDPCGICGFDGSVFFTGRRSDRFVATSDQYQQLFRPFFAANGGIPGINNVPGEYREIVFSVPAGVGGRFAADSSSYFWGADLNLRRNVTMDCTTQANAFMGFRYLHLDEELNIAEFARINQFNPALNIPVGSTMSVFDRFQTTNNFYGCQVGIDYVYNRDKWSIGIRSSVALGSTQSSVSVAGAQVLTTPGAPTQTFNGGLLALNSNSGTQNDNNFAVVPEATLRVGYRITERIKLTAGYDFLYWSSVVRPGDQIDRVLDVNRIPNFRAATPVAAARPAPLLETTDFWAQGINVGAEWTW